MTLTLIAAISENNIIGLDGKLPWPKISEDIKRFIKLTSWHPVIMGRKTWHSIDKKYRPLPNRVNIVITRDKSFKPTGVEVCYSIEEALRAAEAHNKDCFVIGGQQIYQQTIDRADRLEITRVYGKYPGDAVFPEVNWEDWKLLEREKTKRCTFETYRRKIRQENK